MPPGYADERHRLPPYEKKLVSVINFYSSFIDNFSEQTNCQIILKVAELNELLFTSDSDDEHFMCFEAKYIIK